MLDDENCDIDVIIYIIDELLEVDVYDLSLVLLIKHELDDEHLEMLVQYPI